LVPRIHDAWLEHVPSATGDAATALACGKLLGLDEDQLPNALSLAIVPSIPMPSRGPAPLQFEGVRHGGGRQQFRFLGFDRARRNDGVVVDPKEHPEAIVADFSQSDQLLALARADSKSDSPVEMTGYTHAGFQRFLERLPPHLPLSPADQQRYCRKPHIVHRNTHLNRKARTLLLHQASIASG